MKTTPTEQGQTQKVIRKVQVNGLVDNLGNFTFLEFLKSQILSITLISIILSTFFSAIMTKNYCKDPMALFFATSNFLQDLSLYIYKVFFAWSFSTIKNIFEIIEIESTQELKSEILYYLSFITIEKPSYSLINEVYYLLFAIFFVFIMLNMLNILQAKRQNQLRNWKISNYYTPKIIIILEIVGKIDTTSKIYFKKIKKLQRETIFSNEIKSLIIRDYFKIDNDNISKYDLLENIKTFAFFYSIHTLNLVEKAKKEVEKVAADGAKKPPKRYQKNQ